MNDNCFGDNCACSVGCDVTSCRFHGKDNRCHASTITVKNSAAHKKDETYCGTYTPCSGC